MPEEKDVMDKFYEAVLEQIRKTSTELPEDVISALRTAAEKEVPNSPASDVLYAMLENVEAAKERGVPLCQDTGTPLFLVKCGREHSQQEIKQRIINAVREASKRAYLRPNAVDAVTGKNSGDNTGIGFPEIFFEEEGRDTIEVRLLLKGGGSENVGIQYSLPSKDLGAGRDLEGVRRCIINTAFKAQGYGCAPGILGVTIGGDRNTSYFMSKLNFFRKIGDENPDPELNKLEKGVKEEINQLGIGPMGFGGRTTVLDVKINKAHRVPASFFVSVSYLCWAARRSTMTFSEGGVKYD